ncbi:MAG TPA: Gfo/Idh/MocA family oxidoreductase [Candidatus Brocadiia bacterium]|nr:Gfo/Idh/MocA family oxidoreductase [Candidatus Brocadiia bacterium]
MSENMEKEKSGMTRRQFVAGAAAVAAGFGIGRNAQAGVESIGVGFIGAGGRGGSHMDCIRYLREKENLPVDLAAVCDIYRPRMEGKKSHFGIAKGYMDHRELLADPNVDVVCISTPDHHHGPQAIDAIRAGKHVYCEKPVTHWRQFEITKQLADTVAASDRVFLLGTQGMSDSVWHQMKKLVQEDGVIGQPLFGETGFFRIGDWGERGMGIDDPNAQPGPDLNWEAFLGDSPKKPFSVDRLFRWRLFEDYAGGPATDLYPHCLTQVVDILNVGFPDTVVATAGIHRYEYKLREVPDTINLLAQYPEKVTIAVLGTQANDHNTTPTRGAGQRQPVIRGWDGTLTIGNNKEIVFTPVRVSGAKAPQTFPIERGESQTEFWKNLLDCCKTGNKKTWSDMDLAFRTQTILQMAMYSAREAKVAKFDHGKRSIVL